MIVDDPARLHHRIGRDRPGEAEPVPPQGRGQRLGSRCPGRHVVDGLRGDRLLARVTPDHGGQAGGQLERGARVVDRGLDLRPVTHDSSVAKQSLHVLRPERRDGGQIESAERGAEVLALAQDGQPGQARLEGLQAQPLEDARVVADRPAPLLVVVTEIVLAAQAPRTARPAVWPGDGAPHDGGDGWEPSWPPSWPPTWPWPDMTPSPPGQAGSATGPADTSSAACGSPSLGSLRDEPSGGAATALPVTPRSRHNSS